MDVDKMKSLVRTILKAVGGIAAAWSGHDLKLGDESWAAIDAIVAALFLILGQKWSFTHIDKLKGVKTEPVVPPKVGLLLLLAGVMIFAGCAGTGVPTNTMRVDFPNGHSMFVKTEKNNAVHGLKVELAPDGTFKFAFDSWVGTNDPSVVVAGGANVVAQLQQINEIVSKFEPMINAAALAATNRQPTSPFMGISPVNAKPMPR